MTERLSLKAKLPMFVSATMAVVIVVLAVLAYSEVRRAQIEAAHERLQRVSAQLASLTTLGNDARLFSADSAVNAAELPVLLSTSDTDVDTLAQTLRNVTLEIGASEWELLDAQNRWITGSVVRDWTRAPRPSRPASTTAIDEDEDDAEPAPMPRPSVGQILMVDGELAYPLDIPVVSGRQHLGTVVFWRPTARLDEEGRRVLQDLVGANTRILIGSPGAAWTDLLGPIEPPPDAALAGISDADAELPLADYQRDGERIFAVAQALAPTPWVLLAELPADSVLAPARDFLLRLLLLSPLALLVVAANAAFLARTIARSLRETTEAAEAIAAGQVGQRVPVRGNDELGRLAKSFNQMAQQIEDSQRALRDVNASLRTMLDGAPLPIIVLDLENRVRLWNRAAERTLGWSQEETVGERHPLVQPGGERFMIPTGRRGKRGVEAKILSKSGREVDLFVAVAATYSPTGRVDGRIVACDDITARKHAEQQLERYAEDLARSNAELENFAYVASHDLREPLRMVRSFTGLLAERYGDRLDEEADRYITFARDGAERMEALIRALLEYSRVDGDRDAVALTASGKSLREAVKILEPAIREANAEVTFDPLPEVEVNPSQLARVFQNLVGNALKFRGAEPPRIHVSSERRGDHWVFSIADNGIGIDPAYHDRIFQIFKRLHGPDEYGGTGMGLSICKKIIEAHGGAIWVKSQAGGGATFYFTIPGAVARVA